MESLKDKAKHYSNAFTGQNVLDDEANRSQKADKIRAVLEHEGVLPGPDLRVLDIGCSHGIILKRLSREVGYCVGIDIDQYALSNAVKNVACLRADAEFLPFRSDCFDVVICNHVYEHTDNPEQLMAEIERVLTSNGVCYFAGPNKYDLIEPHYRLPFLSWLPRALADSYVRIAGKGTSYPERPYSYSRLKGLLSRFEVKDYTGLILADPVRYRAHDILPPESIKQHLAILVFKTLPVIFPGFIFLLKKRARNSP